MYDYDVIFIGSGHSCNHAGIALTLAGKKVAFVEMGKIGGTCTNFGCDAKILLDSPFVYQEGLKRYEGLCVENVPSIDWSGLMQYKKQNIGMFDPILSDIFTKMGIDIIRAQGKLKDAHTVQAGDKTITAEYIVLGTGQRNARLNIKGNEYLHGSSDFLDLDVMPERLVFIGAGIISMEFASMALALGKSVTIIEFAPRALASYPEQYVNQIVQKMESQGAVFQFNEAVTEVTKSENGYTVTTKNGFSAEADYILDATGRIANVENLGLEELGIEASRKGIKVDDHLRTAVSNIFASGDVIDKTIPKLTPTAEFESNYIASQILGLNPAPIVYPAIPNLVFTLPRIAQVGVTMDEASQNPEKYHVVSVPYGVQNEWIAGREKDASLTYIFDAENYLVGAVVYGSEAGTWIDFLTMVINQKLIAFQLGSMIFAFPTPTYMLVSSLIPLLKKCDG